MKYKNLIRWTENVAQWYKCLWVQSPVLPTFSHERKISFLVRTSTAHLPAQYWIVESFYKNLPIPNPLIKIIIFNLYHEFLIYATYIYYLLKVIQDFQGVL